MYCNKCGKTFGDSNKFCTEDGSALIKNPFNIFLEPTQTTDVPQEITEEVPQDQQRRGSKGDMQSPSQEVSKEVPKVTEEIKTTEVKEVPKQSIQEFIKGLKEVLYFMLFYRYPHVRTRAQKVRDVLKKTGYDRLPEHLEKYKPIIVKVDLVNNDVFITHFEDILKDYSKFMDRRWFNGYMMRLCKKNDMINYNWLYFNDKPDNNLEKGYYRTFRQNIANMQDRYSDEVIIKYLNEPCVNFFEKLLTK